MRIVRMVTVDLKQVFTSKIWIVGLETLAQPSTVLRDLGVCGMACSKVKEFDVQIPP